MPTYGSSQSNNTNRFPNWGPCEDVLWVTTSVLSYLSRPLCVSFGRLKRFIASASAWLLLHSLAGSSTIYLKKRPTPENTLTLPHHSQNGNNVYIQLSQVDSGEEVLLWYKARICLQLLHIGFKTAGYTDTFWVTIFTTLFWNPVGNALNIQLGGSTNWREKYTIPSVKMGIIEPDW